MIWSWLSTKWQNREHSLNFLRTNFHIIIIYFSNVAFIIRVFCFICCYLKSYRIIQISSSLFSIIIENSTNMLFLCYYFVVIVWKMQFICRIQTNLSRQIVNANRARRFASGNFYFYSSNRLQSKQICHTHGKTLV